MTRHVFLGGSLLLAGLLALPSAADAQARPRDPGSAEAGSRSGSGDDGGRMAVPRSDPAPSPSPSSSSPSASSGDSRRRGGEVGSGTAESVRTAQPRESRPREGRTVVGQAVPRGSVGTPQPPIAYPPGRYPWYGYGSGYYPWYGYGSGYYPWYGYGAWGMNFYLWDPFTWWGPSYGYAPYYGGGYYGGSYGGGGVSVSGPSRASAGPANLRVVVEPREARDAQVFVNGRLMGVVDDFNGVWQRLQIEQGRHIVEVRKDGYDTLRFDVDVQTSSTVTLRGELPARP
jgi:hypothetical protein